MGQNVIASFTDISDKPTLADMQPISNLVIDLYKQKEYDRVLVGFTDFRPALLQVPEISIVLPVKRTELLESIEGAVVGKGGDTTQKVDYVFEPDYETLMNIIVEKVARVRMLQMVLESSASEHSARMMAMKNASDAAREMIDDLTLAFNKARQASITQEISEISAGMASVT
jgi:F-type H+-transporting ATPase subunit gamma